MIGDAGDQLPEPPRIEFVMPRMLDVQVQPTRVEPRAPRNFASALPGGGEGFAFVVRTDGPIPIRALGPTLYVGEVAVTEVTQIGPNTYRFVAPARPELKRGTTIRLGWTGQPVAGTESAEFRFQP
jgi:hypothetical protein